MNHSFRAIAGAIVLGTVILLIAANGQTVTVKEINPTNSNSPGLANTSGGRVNHLARAADKVFYAASEFGGLFKSTDGGLTWTRLDRHLPTEMSNVKTRPSDPNRVIATSIYDGRVNSIAGINVSNDGGATWTKPISSNPQASFCDAGSILEPSAFGIAFDPANDTHVFVGTNCGLAKSTDGGLNWSFINPGAGPLAQGVFDVIVHHGGIIDTCGDDGHRRSIDGGVTWTGPRLGGTPLIAGKCSIAASPDESSVLFATVGFHIFETDNGGASWDTSFDNTRSTNREPFVTTNKRQGRNFDLWFGYKDLFRASCKTPTRRGAGPRCPPSTKWIPLTNGAHADIADLVFANSSFNVTACRQHCVDTNTTCKSECDDELKSCMSKVGQPGAPLASQCAETASRCRSKCKSELDSCTADCNQPRDNDACPAVLATDGGTYFNGVTDSPTCQTPKWTQPAVSVRALWLWAFGGTDIPNSLAREAVYMGTQDNGSFASLEAGAVTPTWTKRDGGDIFDIVADNLHVVSTQFCCLTSPGSRVFVRDPGDTDGGEISNYPLGIVPPFKFSDVIVRFGPTRYALIMNDPGSVIGGAAFSTLDITRKPVLWTSLGVSLNTACALWVAGLPTNPTFYAAAGGFCPSFGDSRGFLNRFTGLSTTGQWHSGILPGPSQMVSAFAIDPNNTNRLIASQVIAGGARILRSSDGGTTWVADPVLEGLMTGGGIFRMQTLRYVQPSLLAFDPNDSNTLLAGAVDAGIFLSRNNGATWVALTNNSGDVSNPVIPYPHAAYFDRECGKKNIYVATRGRGVWRFSYDDPAAVSVSKCQSGCDVSLTDCQNECDKLRNECMNETGPGKRLPSQCAELRNTCRATCTNTRDACRQRCTTCPE